MFKAVWQRKHWRLALLVGLSLLVLAACGDGTTTEPDDSDENGVSDEDADVDADGDDAAADDVHTWDFFLFTGAAHGVTETANEFADAVRERTDGTLDITVRPAGELPYAATEVVPRLSDGSIQMGDGAASFVAGECRVASAALLPFLVSTPDEAYDLWPDYQPYVDDCLNEFDLEVFAFYSWPPQNIWGRDTPVESLDELDGLRMRQAGPEFLPFMDLVGVEPVTVATDELSGAMQRGVADAVITAALNMEQQGWHEFLDWGYILEMSVFPSYIMINQDAAAALSDDQRSILEEEGQQFETNLRERFQEWEEESRDTLADLGIEVHEASQAERDEMASAMESAWEEWAEDGSERDQEALDVVRQAVGK